MIILGFFTIHEPFDVSPKKIEGILTLSLISHEYHLLGEASLEFENNNTTSKGSKTPPLKSEEHNSKCLEDVLII